jgi:carbon storage regulator
MLVLSRKKGESIIIGDQIEVKVLSIEGEQVKLGIVAPQTVKVHRSEVFEAIQQQNEEALQSENILTILEEFKKK